MSIECGDTECGTVINVYGCHGKNGGVAKLEGNFNCYSFDEKQTNNIYFGKPVYMKCCEITLPTKAWQYTYAALPLDDLEDIVSIEAVASVNGNYEVLSNHIYLVQYLINSQQLSIRATADRAARLQGIATVFYTKTTDEPVE